MAQLIIISWRDIPAQVIVKRGRETAKVQLSHRFQEAVDRAAMRAGKGSSDAYLADWKRSPPRLCADELKAVAEAEAAVLESRYSDEDLERMIRAGVCPSPWDVFSISSCSASSKPSDSPPPASSTARRASRPFSSRSRSSMSPDYRSETIGLGAP